MNYIYDIVLNFNKDYYNFFEWNKNDCVVNIKKIPLFIINNNIFTNMKYDIVTVSKKFIDLIKEKVIDAFKQRGNMNNKYYLK